MGGGEGEGYGKVGRTPPLPAESPPLCFCGTARRDAPGQDQDQVHESQPQNQSYAKHERERMPFRSDFFFTYGYSGWLADGEHVRRGGKDFHFRCAPAGLVPARRGGGANKVVGTLNTYLTLGGMKGIK